MTILGTENTCDQSLTLFPGPLWAEGGQAAISAQMPRSPDEPAQLRGHLLSKTNSSIGRANKLHYCMSFRCVGKRARRTDVHAPPADRDPSRRTRFGRVRPVPF